MTGPRALGLAAIAFAAGCASSYVAPTRPYTPLRAAPTTFDKAISALTGQGFTIAAMDRASGFLSTAPKVMPLTPAQADCGKTMGLDYLLDSRTRVTVAMSVQVEPDHTILAAQVAGEYRVGSSVNDLTLQCVSTGQLEKTLEAALR